MQLPTSLLASSACESRQHAVQLAFPGSSLYVCTGQAVHAGAASDVRDVNPRSHKQRMRGSAYVPAWAGHSRHCSAPEASEKLSSAQPWHVVSSNSPGTHVTQLGLSRGPTRPTPLSQRQSSMSSRPLSSEEVERATHASHAVAADRFWYVSAGQAVQLASPGPALKLPGAHAAHGPPSGPV